MGGAHSNSKCRRFSSYTHFVREHPIQIWFPPKNSYGKHPRIQIYGNDKFLSKIQHCAGTFYNLLSLGKWVVRIIQKNHDEYNKESIKGE